MSPVRLKFTKKYILNKLLTANHFSEWSIADALYLTFENLAKNHLHF